MIVVTVARKPLSEGNVASNVLKHGCGALNIDASRIKHSSPEDFEKHKAMVDAIKARGGQMEGSWKNSSDLSNANEAPAAGRWPANLILQHLDGCRRVGERSVKSDGHYPSSRPMGSETSGPSGHVGQAGLKERHMDGEVVEMWACAPGCPVASLDAQSGVSKSSGGRIGNKDGGVIYGGGQGLSGAFTPGDPGFGDTGGASRYFKQVGE